MKSGTSQQSSSTIVHVVLLNLKLVLCFLLYTEYEIRMWWEIC